VITSLKGLKKILLIRPLQFPSPKGAGVEVVQKYICCNQASLNIRDKGIHDNQVFQT